jgi:acyl-CoA synthetase (AMP-forming)/AMP-acid ligase II
VIVSLDVAGRVVGEAPPLAVDGGAGGPWRAVPVSAADPAALAAEYSRVVREGGCPLVLPALLGEEQRRRVARAAEGELPGPGHLVGTSGTTAAGGEPKLFFFARDAAVGNARAHVASLGMGEGERVLLPMPLGHSFGLVAAGLGCALTGARLFAFAATPDPATLLAAVVEREVTTLYLTPPLARLLLRHARRRGAVTPSLRRISVGSAGMARAELAELAARFSPAEVYFTYGLTELGPRVSTLGPLSEAHATSPPTPTTAGGRFADDARAPLSEAHATSPPTPTTAGGRSDDHARARLSEAHATSPPTPATAGGRSAISAISAISAGTVGGASDTAPIGRPLAGVAWEVREGELHVRSPYAARGRWRGGRLEPIAAEDGFIATRDAARVTRDGVVLGGRLDGVIVVGGGNLYPEDVERVADDLDGVTASCLVGRGSPLYGEVAVLVCELEAGADRAAVARALDERLQVALPPAQRPVEVLWRPLPRTAAGKIARGALRAELA